MSDDSQGPMTVGQLAKLLESCPQDAIVKGCDYFIGGIFSMDSGEVNLTLLLP